MARTALPLVTIVETEFFETCVVVECSPTWYAVTEADYVAAASASLGDNYPFREFQDGDGESSTVIVIFDKVE